ncbi:fructose-6-phosphate aldolase 2 [Clostridium moniliforme]|uniref:Fructose-6-phosphate aldolase 2 n=1 Tax=Clostridium moniliforme TaxID=39489 RepID=A0ABS4F192_9CLOT|nr:fructose-6-phosphate aldolase [Clostridium moniliforme]MBP1890019.1 fructose-6-phosphate aldolase 2 [Clostridium moniliforme]
MIYMLDTANLNAIRKAFDIYPITGVTTNPTIISKENRDFIGLLKEIREIIGEDTMLHAQVIGKSAEDMIKEAKYLNETIGGNFYVKIPVTKEGIKAIRVLSKEGINITATAIFTAQQALMAAVSGAKFVAPYVNRIDNISGNGVEVVKDIIEELKLYNLDCKVLAASFKNVQQVQDLSRNGVHSVTVNPDIMDKMLEHPLTDWSVDQFINDWEKVYGEGKLTTDVK